MTNNNLKPDKVESIKFMFDTFTKEYSNIYSDFIFCGYSEDSPALVYPMIQGDLLRLREAVDSGVSYLRQNNTLRIMFSHDDRYPPPPPQDEFLKDISSENSRLNIAEETFRWLDNSPEIVNHYVFIGVCREKTVKGLNDIVVVTSKRDDLGVLYCSRRLQEIIYKLTSVNIESSATSLDSLIGNETYERVVNGILRSLAFFDLSRGPLTFVSVISHLIDMIVYHNYPILEELDRESIKNIYYEYMKHAGILTEADAKKIEKQVKQTSLSLLEETANQFLKLIKENNNNE